MGKSYLLRSILHVQGKNDVNECLRGMCNYLGIGLLQKGHRSKCAPSQGMNLLAIAVKRKSQIKQQIMPCNSRSVDLHKLLLRIATLGLSALSFS